MLSIVRIIGVSAAICAACLCSSSAAVAQQSVDWDRVAAAERQVQNLPMLQRPNRLGHFYGNTVRRLHYGRYAVNQGRYRAPVRRYFYLP